MTTKPAPVLARQELILMKVVWSRGHATVREVYETLREARPVAYTTVMTMMRILDGKGHLRKEVEGRAYRYWPTREESTVTAALVHDFVERVFDGAAGNLMAHLVSTKHLSK